MIKLIVTDMDGTLLNDNHEINQEFWNILEDLKKRNINFSVASGRQYYNLVENFKGHEKDIIFIAENGTIVMKDGEEIYFKGLDRKGANKFIEISRNIPEVYAVLCGKNSAYIEDNNEEFKKLVNQYYHHCKKVDNLIDVEDEILKVALFHFTDSENGIYPHYKNFNSDYRVTISGKNWVDIMNKDINKGIALAGLKKKLKLKSENILAFGDYLNDFEMMQEAKYSFAMKNAHEELKKISNFQAPSNNENGVVEVIKEFLSKDNKYIK